MKERWCSIIGYCKPAVELTKGETIFLLVTTLILAFTTPTWGQVAPEAQVDPPAETTGQRGLWLIPRRQDQKRTESGWLASPVVVNIPGIGFFYGGLGSFFNVRKTEADLFVFKVWGDLVGHGLGVIDLPLVFEPLSVNLFWSEQRLAVDSFGRGMNSDPDDVRKIELSRFAVLLGQLSLRLFEKRFQAHVSWNRQNSRTGSIFDKDGNKLADTNGLEATRVNRSYGLILDGTDDRSDPRKGGSLEVQRYDRPEPDSFQSDYYVMDYSLSGFLPIGRFSTWAFNLYRSDAIVTRTGEIDPAVVAAESGIVCEALPEADRGECEQTRDRVVEETIADNRHGSAASLGGPMRLSGYPTGRFTAGHTMYYGSEFRWNLTEEFTPFNWLVAGGVRSGLQIAVFGGYGGVADTPDKLHDDMVASYGAGFRLLVASGFIVRFDLAFSDEGMQPVVLFSYPWQVF